MVSPDECGWHRTDWPLSHGSNSDFSGFRYRAFQYRESQYNGSAIKQQESGSPDFSEAVRKSRPPPIDGVEASRKPLRVRRAGTAWEQADL
jgi:hypothetical protein